MGPRSRPSNDPAALAAVLVPGPRDELVPRGPFDPRRLERRPVRVVRGGTSGVVVAYRAHADRVSLQLFSVAPLPPEEVPSLFGVARALAGLDDDPTEFLAMVIRHPLLGDLARVHDARMRIKPTVFEAFADAVVEQLVTVSEARTSLRKLGALAGDRVAGTTLRSGPTAEGVRRVPMWKLHAIGIGSRRAATLRSGALRGAALERLRQDAPEVALTKLQSLPGVGPWTANHVAKNALGWADAIPYGDVHAHYVITGFLTGREGDDDAMVRALEPFRPHRARVVALVDAAIYARRELPGVRRRSMPRIDPHRREPWRY